MVALVAIRYKLIERVHLSLDLVRVMVTLLINEVPDRSGLHQPRQGRGVRGQYVPTAPQMGRNGFPVRLPMLDEPAGAVQQEQPLIDTATGTHPLEHQQPRYADADED